MEEAVAALEQSVEEEAWGDAVEWARYIGHERYNEGEYEKALVYHLKALEYGDHVGDEERVISLRLIGVTYIMLEEFETALQYHAQHLNLALQIQDQMEVLRAYHNLAYTHEKRHAAHGDAMDLQLAIQNYTESINRTKEVVACLPNTLSKYHEHLISGLFNLGCLHLSTESYAEAAEMLNVCARHCKRLREPRLSSALTYLAAAMQGLHCGRDETKAVFEEALATASSLSDTMETLHRYAIFTKETDIPLAVKLAKRAVESSQSIGDLEAMKQARNFVQQMEQELKYSKEHDRLIAALATAQRNKDSAATHQTLQSLIRLEYANNKDEACASHCTQLLSTSPALTAFALVTLGDLDRRSGSYRSAVERYRSALTMHQEAENEVGCAKTYLLIAEALAADTMPTSVVAAAFEDAILFAKDNAPLGLYKQAIAAAEKYKSSVPGDAAVASLDRFMAPQPATTSAAAPKGSIKRLTRTVTEEDENGSEEEYASFDEHDDEMVAVDRNDWNAMDNEVEGDIVPRLDHIIEEEENGEAAVVLGSLDSVPRHQLEMDLKRAHKEKNLEREMQIAHTLGLLYMQEDDFETALVYHRKDLELGQLLHLDSELVTPLRNIAVCFRELGHFDRAIAYHSKNIKRAKRHGMLRIQSEGECECGNTYLAWGEAAEGYEAISKYTDALRAFQSALKHCQSDQLRARVLYNIALCYDALEEYEKAIQYFSDSLKAYQQEDQLHGALAVQCFSAYGMTLSSNGDVDDAVSKLKKALRICNLGDLFEEAAFVNNDICIVMLRACRFKEAKSYAKVARELLHELTDVPHLADLRQRVGIHYRAAKQGLKVTRVLDSMEKKLTGVRGDKPRLQLFGEMTDLAASISDHRRVIKYGKEVETLALSLGQPLLAVDACFAAASSLVHVKKYQEAVRMWESVLQTPDMEATQCHLAYRGLAQALLKSGEAIQGVTAVVNKALTEGPEEEQIRTLQWIIPTLNRARQYDLESTYTSKLAALQQPSPEPTPKKRKRHILRNDPVVPQSDPPSSTISFSSLAETTSASSVSNASSMAPNVAPKTVRVHIQGATLLVPVRQQEATVEWLVQEAEKRYHRVAGGVRIKYVQVRGAMLDPEDAIRDVLGPDDVVEAIAEAAMSRAQQYVDACKAKSVSVEETIKNVLSQATDKIVLHGLGISSAAVEPVLQALMNDSSINEVDLGANPLTDACLATLHEVIPTWTGLQTLALQGTGITAQGWCQLLQFLEQCNGLRTVCLGFNAIDDSSTDALLRLVRTHTHLVQLDVQHCDIQDSDRALVRGLEQEPHLPHVVLIGNPLSFPGSFCGLRRVQV